ncbi:hypothetical protein ABZ682_23190 [Streptomyces griseoviridis]|uniref:hypothetical protein n=1 Tax=Streptomyces griseoviridis TaxID=45398 RepID=UPI0033CD5F1D
MADMTTRLHQIADWYGVVLQERPAGPDREALEVLLSSWQAAADRAASDPSRAVGVAFVQWARVLLIIAEAERERGQSGWQPDWTDVYEEFVAGDDPVHGPLNGVSG